MYIATHNQRGFTLIELLVVISIIGVLASIVLASLNDAREKARDAQRQSDMNQLRNALELYRQDNGRYPNSNDCSAAGECYGSGSFKVLGRGGGIDAQIAPYLGGTAFSDPADTGDASFFYFIANGAGSGINFGTCGDGIAFGYRNLEGSGVLSGAADEADNFKNEIDDCISSVPTYDFTEILTF